MYAPSMSLNDLQVVLFPQAAPLLLCTCLVLTALVLFFTRCSPREAHPFPPGHVPGLSSHRAALLLGTCASILAVDFSLFPLRLAKTAREGYSLMDLGSGSFVFAHGAPFCGVLSPGFATH